MQNLSGGTRFKCYPGPFSSVSYNFTVCRNENIIDEVKNRVAVYEDSILQHYKMVEIAAYKDSVANRLWEESKMIKRVIGHSK